MTDRPPAFTAIEEAYRAGDHQAVLRQTDAALAAQPGDDAAHELRARSLLAVGRLEDAERHAADAVRLDPDEIRYRELLAELRARLGAHGDAAAEYARLARNDPAQPAWTLAEAQERLGAAEPEQAVEAARRAVRLDPRNAEAQLTLSRGLVRLRDPRGALIAADAAVQLLPTDPRAREALADALWLADRPADAFAEFRALDASLRGADRERVLRKARALYRQRAGWLGRVVASWPAAFAIGFRAGWLTIG
jgi:tetratricopeptide (TPR) repeat protein